VLAHEESTLSASVLLAETNDEATAAAEVRTELPQPLNVLNCDTSRLEGRDGLDVEYYPALRVPVVPMPGSVPVPPSLIAGIPSSDSSQDSWSSSSSSSSWALSADSGPITVADGSSLYSLEGNTKSTEGPTPAMAASAAEIDKFSPVAGAAEAANTAENAKFSPVAKPAVAEVDTFSPAETANTAETSRFAAVDRPAEGAHTADVLLLAAPQHASSTHLITAQSTILFTEARTAAPPPSASLSHSVTTSSATGSVPCATAALASSAVRSPANRPAYRHVPAQLKTMPDPQAASGNKPAHIARFVKIEQLQIILIIVVSFW
jgi:hypothetical protein